MARRWGGGMAGVDQARGGERRAMGDTREREREGLRFKGPGELDLSAGVGVGGRARRGAGASGGAVEPEKRSLLP